VSVINPNETATAWKAHTREAAVQLYLSGADGDAAALVGARSSGVAGPFRFSLDPLQRAAKIGRRRIPLTRAEYRLLECLWERRPNPASRQDLLDHLYGEDADQPSDAVIDVVIFKIRQKLRNAGCTDASIEVVRGEGWYLNLDPTLVEDDAQTDEAEANEPAPVPARH